MEQCQEQVESFSLQDALDNQSEAMQQESQATPLVRYITPLESSEFACDYIDPTIYQKSGVLLQFCNTNASAHATIIGGIRLAVEDIRKVPAYLHRYRMNIKKIAVKALSRHLQDSQCSVGLNESLSMEDYGMTFTVATLSQRARQLNPQGRGEGPLFYCLFPGHLDPTILMANADGTYQTQHIINLYIHLLPAHHRRVVLARKITDKAEADVSEGPNSKKPRPAYEAAPRPQVGYPPYPETRVAYNERRQQYDNTINHKINQKVEEMVNKKLTTASLASAFPPLPSGTKGPSWAEDDELPEN